MLQTIFERRSIRKYKTDPVGKDKIETLLRAAQYAPSAVDKRPWHFIVVDDRKTIEAFMAEHRYAGMLAEAPVLILVCGDTERQAAPLYYLQDCAAATQNILLAACELGLGTCWLGIRPEAGRTQPFKALFGLPAHIEPFCGIAVGYPDESREVAERYDETRIHRNVW